MLKNKKRQSYIINGVSGPGKTESAKIILEYYNNFNNDEISKIILDKIIIYSKILNYMKKKKIIISKY